MIFLLYVFFLFFGKDEENFCFKKKCENRKLKNVTFFLAAAVIKIFLDSQAIWPFTTCGIKQVAEEEQKKTNIIMRNIKYFCLFS